MLEELGDVILFLAGTTDFILGGLRPWMVRIVVTPNNVDDMEYTNPIITVANTFNICVIIIITTNAVGNTMSDSNCNG